MHIINQSSRILYIHFDQTITLDELHTLWQHLANEPSDRIVILDLLETVHIPPRLMKISQFLETNRESLQDRLLFVSDKPAINFLIATLEQLSRMRLPVFNSPERVMHMIEQTG